MPTLLRWFKETAAKLGCDFKEGFKLRGKKIILSTEDYAIWTKALQSKESVPLGDHPKRDNVTFYQFIETKEKFIFKFPGTYIPPRSRLYYLNNPDDMNDLRMILKRDRNHYSFQYSDCDFPLVVAPIAVLNQYGLYSANDIEVGETQLLLGFYEGYVTRKIDQQADNESVIQGDKNYYVDASTFGNHTVFVHHSRENNVETVTMVNPSRVPDIAFNITKNIKKFSPIYVNHYPNEAPHIQENTIFLGLDDNWRLPNEMVRDSLDDYCSELMTLGHEALEQFGLDRVGSDTGTLFLVPKLHKAISDRNLPAFKECLQNCKDPNIFPRPVYASEDGFLCHHFNREEKITPLMYACSSGEIEFVKLLLEHEDVAINRRMRYTGQVAFHLLLMAPINEERKKEMAEVLLSHQPDLNIIDRNGKTFIDYCEKYHLPEIKKLLFKAFDLQIENEGNAIIDTPQTPVDALMQSHVNISTEPNGNCCFNAFALGMCDLVINDMLIIRNPDFYKRLSNSLQIDISNIYDLKVWFSNHDSLTIQREISPFLRQLAVDTILNSYQHYQETYERLLQEAFLNYKRNNVEDDMFLVHSAIKKAFDEKTLNTETLMTWWREHGKDQYFKDIRQPAESVMDRSRWASEIEVAALAILFDIRLTWHKGMGQQQLGIGSGLIPLERLTDNEQKLLADVGMGQPYLQFFRINSLNSIAELEKRLSPIHQAEYVISKLSSFLDGKVGQILFPDSLEGIQDLEALKQELIARNVITIKDNSYYFISERDKIMERLQGIPGPLADTVKFYFQTKIPEIHIQHVGEHWNYLQPTSDYLKQKTLEFTSRFSIRQTLLPNSIFSFGTNITSCNNEINSNGNNDNGEFMDNHEGLEDEYCAMEVDY